MDRSAAWLRRSSFPSRGFSNLSTPWYLVTYFVCMFPVQSTLRVKAIDSRDDTDPPPRVRERERERQSPNQQQLANTKDTHTGCKSSIEYQGSIKRIKRVPRCGRRCRQVTTLVAGGRGRWWNEEVYADVYVPIRVWVFGCERWLVCVKLCRGLWCVLCVLCVLFVCCSCFGSVGFVVCACFVKGV